MLRDRRTSEQSRARARVLIGVAGVLIAVALGLLPGGAAAAGTLATPSSTDPQLVQATGATETVAATSLTASFSAPTAAGDLLVLSASEYTGTTNRITSVTDSTGRAWARAGSYGMSGHNSDGEMWYAANAGTVATVTARTKSSVVMALSVQEFSGVMSAGPLDLITGASASSTSASSGPVTPTVAGALAVGFVAGHANKQAINVTAPGYNVQPQRTSAAAHVASVVTGYRTVSTVAAQTFTASSSKAMYWAAGIALFKPAIAPPNDFSIAVTPGGAGAVTAGQSVTVTVVTSVTSGVSQPVALSVTGLPDGASASFSPSTVSAGETATMTIRPSVSTAAATTSLTVVGTGTSAIRSAPVGLTVTTPAVIRAAFYYPWFPDAWAQQGLNPFTNYIPARGYYSTDVATVSAQIADLQYAGVTLGIASWFGLGSNTEKHWPAIMQAAQGTGFAWAPYYEKESTSDPTPQQITDDLQYLRTTYGGTGSALASLPGKGMPVFVYNTDSTNAQGCDTVDRWNQARQLLQQEYGESIYIDLKVFPQYYSCTGSTTIDGWHQYAPTTAQWNFAAAPGDGSFTISPGYWKAGTAYGTAPFLGRDRTRWQGNVAAMNSSGAKWQLITTYNEWGEGTAIESASACGATAPAGTYCDWGGGSVSAFIADLHAATPPS